MGKQTNKTEIQDTLAIVPNMLSKPGSLSVKPQAQLIVKQGQVAGTHCLSGGNRAMQNTH